MIAYFASTFAVLSIYFFGKKPIWGWRFAAIEMCCWIGTMIQFKIWGMLPVNVIKSCIVIWALLKKKGQ